MATFGEDKKWLEAKKVVGDLDWVEIVSYYKMVGGKSAFVYVAGEGQVKQIVDILDEEDNVILLNNENEIEIDTIDNVTKSKKIFKYTEDTEEKRYEFGRDVINIHVPT